MDTMHRMLMYCTVCQHSGNNEKVTALSIISGFVGQLRGWWETYMTAEQKSEILNSKKIIKTEAGTSAATGQEDAVYTLCLAILHHFIGTTIPISENISTLLQNLRCPTLGHFRWYRDTFLSRVYQLSDSNSTHWKSKFIDGLPNLFSDKVRQSLRSKNDGVNINYSNLSYGQIINICIAEGLNLCNDVKLKKQLKEQKSSERHQICDFCEQFAFDTGKPKQPSNKESNCKTCHKKGKNPKSRNPHHEIGNSYKDKYKDKYKRNFYKSKFQPRKPLQTKGKRKAKRLDITCHKCGKVGHYADKCWTKKALNELQDEKLRSQLQKILINSDNESAIDEEVNYIETTSSSSDKEDCQKNEINYWKSIVEMNNLNVLTTDQEEILKTINAITDKTLKEKMLKTLLQSNTEIPVVKTTPFQLGEVLRRFQQINTKESPISVIDLKREITILKTEISQIKNDNELLDERIKILEDDTFNRTECSSHKSENIPFKINNNEEDYLNLIEQVTSQKWFVKITLAISKSFILQWFELFVQCLY